jgi:hypothetical protein
MEDAMTRTIAAAVFALLTAVTASAKAATLTLWNLDLKTNSSICGSPFVCSPQETVTGNFVFYNDTSGDDILSWNIQATGPDTFDFYQSIGQTATTVEAGFPTDAYLFFNFDGSPAHNLTLDFGASRDALLTGTSNISIGAFQPTVIQDFPLGGAGVIPLSGTLDYGGTTLDNLPLPAALPLFGSGVLALAGFAAYRSRRNGTKI